MQTLSEIKGLLLSRGLRPRHRFGQNFLHDHNVLRTLLSAAKIRQGEVILEVGPGTGVLTDLLVEAGAEVIACELDRDLALLMRERFGKRIRLIEGDCLAGKHSLNPEITALIDGRTFRLIANLPYQAATPLIATLMNDFPNCEGMIVTIQREVAQRLAAAPGTHDMGLLSVMAQFYAVIRKVADIRPGSFWPEPEVDSAIIEIAPHKPRPTPPARMHELLECAYQHRRKQLGSSLGDRFRFPEGFDRTRRPETLSVAEWVALANFQT
ncbi:MAG: 16S rRNA (adenine(1518)-N(6)/adenine(1519)-N(6))-dimethyltransferase RsmA [Planctomycetes bacterium]|nr:16S rRNA (adenine(1518)-N(6)/adenine(1519)-N(6))-dimethyltransferase RsmA [Planctomycetota bacterium]